MKQIESVTNGMPNKHPGYICTTAEFTTETDEVDGATLTVVDESTHAVKGVYVAYNGQWFAY